ncbi:MAG: PHP domain-containing protein [Myxococcota bacterium]
MRLDEDHHVHSTFSDGKHTLRENTRRAEEMGLKVLGCVDHVRRDSCWLPGFVEAVRLLSRETPVTLLCGVEAKLLDEEGRLDIPEATPGVDVIFAADHRVPLGSQCHDPKQVRAGLEDGSLRAEQVIDALVRSSCRAMQSDRRVAIAHLFSVLPKLRLDETMVEERHLDRLAEVSHQTGCWFEVDERWRAPGPRVAEGLWSRGVCLKASSDAHVSYKIGLWRYLSSLSFAQRGSETVR